MSRTPSNFVPPIANEATSSASSAHIASPFPWPITGPAASSIPQAGFGNGAAPSAFALSQDSTPFSWSPSPRPFPFPPDSQPPTSTDSVASQASVNDPFGTGAMIQGGKRGRGSRGGKQSLQSHMIHDIHISILFMITTPRKLCNLYFPLHLVAFRANCHLYPSPSLSVGMIALAKRCPFHFRICGDLSHLIGGGCLAM